MTFWHSGRQFYCVLVLGWFWIIDLLGSKSRDLICGIKEVHIGPSKTLSKELASKQNPDAPGCRLLLIFPTWTLWQDQLRHNPSELSRYHACVHGPMALPSSNLVQLGIFSRGEEKRKRSWCCMRSHTSKPSGLPWEKNPTFSVESFD